MEPETENHTDALRYEGEKTNGEADNRIMQTHDHQAAAMHLGAVGTNATEGGVEVPPQRITQQECCARHERRQDALKLAISAFGPGNGFFENQIVEAARVFEAYLAGDDQAT